MERRYDTRTYQKHKRPGGWGSLCPAHIAAEAARALLTEGVLVEGAIYNVAGRDCFRALKHGEEGGDELWHGHPIPWSRLPTKAKTELVASGRLDPTIYRKALRQGWGREVDR